jgi:hypothetical protein
VPREPDARRQHRVEQHEAVVLVQRGEADRVVEHRVAGDGGRLGLAPGHDQPRRAAADERAERVDDGHDGAAVVGRPVVTDQRPRPVGRGPVAGPGLGGERRRPVGVGDGRRGAGPEQATQRGRQRLPPAAEPVVARAAGEVVRASGHGDVGGVRLTCGAAAGRAGRAAGGVESSERHGAAFVSAERVVGRRHRGAGAAPPTGGSAGA